MYPHQNTHEKAMPGQPPSAASTQDYAGYIQSEHEELFGPDGTGLKARVVAHPLFEQLLAAHVACLRVATPQEQQHIIDSALANRHHVEAKYLALLSHLQISSHPAENEELTHFMVNYILLLHSFKDEIHHHLRTQASRAIVAHQEIEQELFNLSGVSSFGSSMAMIQKENKYNVNDDADKEEIGSLGINAFFPYKIQKSLREYAQRKLENDLKKDYQSKLKELHDDIARKRRVGKLSKETTHLLREWLHSHAQWPYPSDEDKVQLMEETGLEWKQINNWFTNQRKGKWQVDTKDCGGSEKNSMNPNSNSINMTLLLKPSKSRD